MQKANDVKIDYEKYGEFGKIIDLYKGKMDVGAFGKFKIEDGKKRIGAKVLLNALNFRFWEKKDSSLTYFETEYKGKKERGAGALFASISRALDEKMPILEPAYLTDIDGDAAEKIFRGTTKIPMLYKRTEIMNELGRQREPLDAFLNRTEKDYWKLVEAVAISYPSYRDVWSYGTVRVPFLKRAQLLVSSLHVQGDVQVKNTETGSVFADYRVPQALRELGIVNYSAQLANAVDSLTELSAGTFKEVEIRAASIVVCDRLAKEYDLKIVEIDNILWMHGRNCKKPHHLTTTTSY
jgi:hypothetical protein